MIDRHGGEPEAGASQHAEAELISGRTHDWYEAYGIRHMALVPDGNRRWARERGVPIEIGHSKGLLQVMPDLVHKLSDAGVHTITVWGFSTENWNRARGEVDHLMTICASFLRHNLLPIAERHGARFHHIGRIDRVHPEVRDALAYVTEATAKNEDHVYNLAFDYGGRDEVARASRRMLQALRDGAPESTLRVEDFLDTRGQPYPEPDLVIRSSGEYRTSGFMPWQAAYSELFFLEQYFPDFTFELLCGVAEEFRMRKRRFGGG